MHSSSAPREPAPPRWRFPPVTEANEHGVVGVGADLEPGTVLAAYRQGLFPMPVAGRNVVAWWSPDPRGILPLEDVKISRSLRRSMDRYDVRVDTAFGQVIRACADPSRDHGWIDKSIIDAYSRLHVLGWVHSVETWDETGALVGGLYGVSIGGLFAGESMFHRATDASKVALVHLASLLQAGGASLLDVQWLTPHLASLGAVEIPRTEYLRRLHVAIDQPIQVFDRH